MPGNRFNQGSKTTSKPRALNSVKKSVGKPSKTVSKKRSSKKKYTSPPSVSSGFSLYSNNSDSSAGVSSLNHGLDRCAALLANILDEDGTSVVPSKTSSVKKQSGQSRQPLNGNQSPRPTRTAAQQSVTMKKSKPVTSIQTTTQPDVKGFNKPRFQNHGAMPTLQVNIPQVTQFNNRLVSSTPDMGSPSSDHYESRCVTDTQSTHLPGFSPHGDPSLDTLAAQIQMMRSQAEVNEELTEHIPVRDTSARVQAGSKMKPLAFQNEKVEQNKPKQLLQSLTDHLKDRNKRHQEFPTRTSEPKGNMDQSQACQVQIRNARNTGQKFPFVSNHPVSQQTPLDQVVEPPESRNTSFIPEYLQLPNQNIRSSKQGEMILQQLNEIQSTVTSPVSHHLTLQDRQNNEQMINQHFTSINPVKLNQMTDQSSVQIDEMIPSQISEKHHQSETIQTSGQQKRETENRSNMLRDNPNLQVCMATQTYSPPADKGVQTSLESSSSSPDINVVPTKDTVRNPLQDTPHPQPEPKGKKTASWEQMRVLKYLIRELRAAIRDIGDDIDVQRLLTEMEECLDTLQYLPPDLQTEIGLALQPLRSENSQLRRRLRIANQQIKRLEKGDDKENVEPSVDVEVLTLQSLNAKLQKELRAEVSKQERLLTDNTEYKTTIEKMMLKHQDFMKVLQQKDIHQLESRQEWMEEKSTLNNQLDEMRSHLKDLQLKVDATDHDNKILRVNLEQRDAEIAQLQQSSYSKHSHPKSKVTYNVKDSVGDSDEDDDDVTPKASPQHSPQKTYSHSLPPAKHNLKLAFLNQCSETADRTTRFGTISDNYSGKDYSPQRFTKRVTFAGYVSPKDTMYKTQVADASARNGGYVVEGKPQYQAEKWVRGGQYDFDDTEREHNTSDSSDLFYAKAADTEFPMKRFLEQSRHYSSDEDVPEPDYTDIVVQNSNQANVYTTSTVPYEPVTNTAIDFVEERPQSHQIRSHSSNSKRNESKVFPLKASSRNEIFQQGTVLDGSIGGIDSSSTQSSVTSQYEAQFQLGLANLDSEIAKLQNSLRSISTKKPMHKVQR